MAGLAVWICLIKPGWLSQQVGAKPAFMDRYNRDPYAKDELRGKCTICHIGRGGGERNDFGEAFEDAGYRITPKLREKFPQLFTSPKAKPDADSLPEQATCSSAAHGARQRI
ncbi:MAG: hypothetical protein ABIU20_03050 [Blastocatellia bacterium]